MKSSLLLSTFVCAAVASGQTTSSPGSTSQSSSTSSAPAANSSTPLKIRGPEAVAKQDPNRVVATINGKQITAKQAADLLKAIPPEQLKQYQSNLASVVQQIYTSQQLAQQAVKLNLDQQSPYKEQIELNRDNILARAYLNKVASNASSTGSPDAQQYYNSHQGDFDRLKLSGIFIGFNPPGTPASSASNNRTEEQARSKADEIEKKLKAGGDFATLARTESDNQQSAARGGEIGTFSVGDPQLPPSLKTAVEKLQPGQVSEPVRVPTAFLIVKLESRDKLTFDQAKPEIVQKLQNDRNQAAVKQEVDKYKIQVQDPDFFSASSGPGANIPSLQRSAPAAPRSASAPPGKP